MLDIFGFISQVDLTRVYSKLYNQNYFCKTHTYIYKVFSKLPQNGSSEKIGFWLATLFLIIKRKALFHFRVRFEMLGKDNTKSGWKGKGSYGNGLDWGTNGQNFSQFCKVWRRNITFLYVSNRSHPRICYLGLFIGDIRKLIWEFSHKKQSTTKPQPFYKMRLREQKIITPKVIPDLLILPFELIWNRVRKEAIQTGLSNQTS